MKLLPILPLVVGTAVAGILASTSPAHALNWNWSYSGTGIAAAGTFTTDDIPDGSGFYLINAITGTRNGTAITGLSSPGGLGGNDNLISQSAPNLNGNGFTYSWNSSFLNVYYDSQLSLAVEGGSSVNSGSSTVFNSVTFAATPVPFDIPGGATIPTVGSLLALAAMRKVRKSIAPKTAIASPICETVS